MLYQPRKVESKSIRRQFAKKARTGIVKSKLVIGSRFLSDLGFALNNRFVSVVIMELKERSDKLSFYLVGVEMKS